MPEETQDAAVDQVVPADPSNWDEQPAVTGRPNDIPAEGPPLNSTFAERAAARNKQQKTETAKADAQPPAKRRARKAS